ncbi:hypothetical protein [Nocardioides sp. MH1]|uniref:hypothetical protein n=1 Tax=Nocardioides sp. MH1 TaxID=3242490 RepID=UPI003520EEFD
MSTAPLPTPPPQRCWTCGTTKAACDAGKAEGIVNGTDPNRCRCCSTCCHPPRSRLPRIPGATGADRRGRRGREALAAFLDQSAEQGADR